MCYGFGRSRIDKLRIELYKNDLKYIKGGHVVGGMSHRESLIRARWLLRLRQDRGSCGLHKNDVASRQKQQEYERVVERGVRLDIVDRWGGRYLCIKVRCIWNQRTTR